MSTNISQNVLKKFLLRDLGINHLTKNEAKKFDIKADKFTEANLDENNYLDVAEILDDKDLYAQFATLYVEEQDKRSEAKDKEKQKEEQAKIGEKSGAKA